MAMVAANSWEAWLVKAIRIKEFCHCGQENVATALVGCPYNMQFVVWQC